MNAVARYYEVARTAHVERLGRMVPADFFFSVTRADWDEGLAATTPYVRRTSFAKFLAIVGRGRYHTIEVQEPLALASLPKVLAICWVAGFTRMRRGRGTRVVIYAIENFDPRLALQSKFRVPNWIATSVLKTAVGGVLRRTSSIAFGTDASRENYEQLFGADWGRVTKNVRIRTIQALPSGTFVQHRKRARTACFLGSFEERKGILQLLAAWPQVAQMERGAKLTIMGHGPLESVVVEFAKRREDVTLLLDPSRTIIRQQLADAKCLVLLSQHTDTWREQVGLPIVESLEAGCEVVVSADTGLAGWLASHGHQVVHDPKDVNAVSDAIVHAMRATRTPIEVVGELPRTDGRIEADAWLFGQSADDET